MTIPDFFQTILEVTAFTILVIGIILFWFIAIGIIIGTIDSIFRKSELYIDNVYPICDEVERKIKNGEFKQNEKGEYKIPQQSYDDMLKEIRYKTMYVVNSIDKIPGTQLKITI